MIVNVKNIGKIVTTFLQCSVVTQTMLYVAYITTHRPNFLQCIWYAKIITVWNWNLLKLRIYK